jgi:hypothetical protein
MPEVPLRAGEGRWGVKGRRLPVVDGAPTWPTEPGDYCGPVLGYTGDVPAVFFLKPNARDPGADYYYRAIQHVVSPPHTFRECPDGSLEIRDSLGDAHDGWSDGWHGYLDEGHMWRRA